LGDPKIFLHNERPPSCASGPREKCTWTFPCTRLWTYSLLSSPPYSEMWHPLYEESGMARKGPSCEATPSFRQRLAAKINIHGRERAAPPRRNIDFVARTSVLDQIALVPKTDRTGAPSYFAFGPPLTLLVWIGGSLWHRKSNAGERG
jgi:hypothetical protein